MVRLGTRLIAALCCLLLTAASAFAQSQSIQQSGPVTPGHVGCWTTNGILQDCGVSTNGYANTFGITANGGLPFCLQDVRDHTGPYRQMCQGVSASGANIYVNGFNGASAPPFQIIIDGVPYSFPGNAVPVARAGTMAQLSSYTAGTMAAGGTFVLSAFHTNSVVGGGVFNWVPAANATGLTPDTGIVIAPSDHTGTCAFGCLVRNLTGITADTSMWGAYQDVLQVFDGHTSSVNKNVTSATAKWVAGDVGKPITLTISGVAFDTTIATFVSTTAITVTDQPPSTSTSAVLTWGHDDSAAVTAAFAWQASTYRLDIAPQQQKSITANLHLGSSYVTTGFRYAPGARVDGSGGCLYVGAHGLTVLGGFLQVQDFALGNFDNDATAATNICIEGLGHHGVGWDFNFTNLAVDNRNIFVDGFVGSNISGITATTSTMTNVITVSANTRLVVGHVYKIAGVTEDGLPQMFDIAKISGTSVTLDQVPAVAVSTAAMTEVSTCVTVRGVNVTDLYGEIVAACDLGTYVGSAEDNGSGYIPPTTDFDIFGGGQHENGSGMYVFATDTVHIYDYHFHFSQSGPELYLHSVAAARVFGDFEEDTSGLGSIPVVYVAGGAISTELNAVQGANDLNTGTCDTTLWRRFIWNEGIYTRIGGYRSQATTAACPNPSHGGDYAFLLYLGGSVGIGEVAGWLGSPSYTSSPSLWAVNGSFTYPIGGVVSLSTVNGVLNISPLNTSAPAGGHGELYTNSGNSNAITVVP